MTRFDVVQRDGQHEIVDTRTGERVLAAATLADLVILAREAALAADHARTHRGDRPTPQPTGEAS